MGAIVTGAGTACALRPDALAPETIEELFRRGLELSPSSKSHALHAFYLMALGRSEDAIAEQTRARALDPISPVMNQSLAFPFDAFRGRRGTTDRCGLWWRILFLKDTSQAGSRSKHVPVRHAGII